MNTKTEALPSKDRGYDGLIHYGPITFDVNNYGALCGVSAVPHDIPRTLTTHIPWVNCEHCKKTLPTPETGTGK